MIYNDYDPTTTADLFDLIPEDTPTCLECVGDTPGTVFETDCAVSADDVITPWTCTLPPFGVPF